MKYCTLLFFFFFVLQISQSQVDSIFLKTESYDALKFRNIGPALTSGRISDIVIHPDNQNIMYVSAGSGNVWKTENAGTTWKPIFEKEGSYSIGCVTLDPSNPHTVWVGTGENVGGRHVGFGDGIYKSNDGGSSWKNMGLKDSEHLSKIVVHPSNSNILWVAAQGPLWSKGGERGLYKSEDGGKNWAKTLGDDEWTGVTDIVMDPRNHDHLYAATWQRHRTVAAYMGGGPQSGIHRSLDGGVTWEKLSEGLPKSNLGKIGLALSPFNADRIYAAVETDRKKGGLYMSTDRGSTWVRQSDMISGGTGPHYYQELYADPHQEGRIYLMNNYVLISDDHGKNYYQMNEKRKHVDTHAIAWRENDPNYVLMGTDGGLYETFDKTKTWRYVSNLPLTQYYKLAVDDAEPFYNIYGGTQDNGSHKGPSRTMSKAGIQNRDWTIVLGADGHQSATEPGNPNISYGEFQEGFLWRIDHKTKESVYIRPEPGPDEPYERFNWDAPILVSQHDPKRIYFASQRIWRSDNRGDDWISISEDLTKNEERITLPIMGKQQSWDNPWDVDAMSNYNTITSLAESPKNENILYAGTDDGIIQVSTDGGDNWTKINTNQLSGSPKTAFVNDIRADLHEENTVYCALDNHKYGDFKPYLYKSVDAGKTWKSISSNLPKRLLVWRIVQDHVDPQLLFIATEFGIYYSNNGGEKWMQLKGGLPTISFRDITIQRRENDLVAASFGRSFFVLDDYSALRNFNKDEIGDKDGVLFDTRKAYWYTQVNELYGQGNAHYEAPNPSYGATFTYYLKDSFETKKEARTKMENELAKNNKNIPFPGWDALDEELNIDSSAIYLIISDQNNKVLKRIKGPAKKGLNRISWDLGIASKAVIKVNDDKKKKSWWDDGSGYKATPGTYTVTLAIVENGIETILDGPNEFEVVPLLEPTIKGASYDQIISFRNEYEAFQKDLTLTNTMLSDGNKMVVAMEQAFINADSQPTDLYQKIKTLKKNLIGIDTRLNGNKSKKEIGEKNNPTPGSANLLGWVALNNTYGPTGNHMKAFKRAEDQLSSIQKDLSEVVEVIPGLLKDLEKVGAPYIKD